MTKKFLINVFRFLIIGSIPVIIMLAAYFVYDPFKVVWKYKDFSNLTIIPNRDYVSTETFLHNSKQYNYNSFIFGSSRTLAFRPEFWSKFLNDDDKPFMFDASGESIYGIYKKIKFLEEKNIKIDNALIILCSDVSFEKWNNHEGHLFIKHPQISGESYFKFHLTFLDSYSDPRFMRAYYEYKLTGDYKPHMKDYIETRRIEFHPVTNRMFIVDQENELEDDSDEYYRKRMDEFAERNSENGSFPDQIVDPQVLMMKEIREILERNETNYKIIISPLYDQKKFSPKDMDLIKNTLGVKNVYDFSGRNVFTDNYRNYYEKSHFRPHVGDSIIRYVYSE